VKEADLRAAVEGFEKSAGLPNELSDRWKKELCRLLNKVLRPARFANRLKTGCAWCGRATPRKSKVRELAYLAAVNNLRVRETFRLRPLNDNENERGVFLKWWSDPKTAPGVDSIKNCIVKMNPDQKGMARQFYDLLKNPEPKGRASLCVQHLAMAAEGKTMKDAGVDWQTISVRKAPNPCRERRDARVLHRLEQILFRPGGQGEAAWRYGPVSYITLEIPEPGTERPDKGQQAARQEKTLKERLAEETDGCVYKVVGGCGGPMEKDHIFPRSRGGPDVRVNLVAACNLHNEMQKANQTPFEWLGSTAQWGAFREHVQGLKIGERKKKILLNETDQYPESDPTPLARVGARPRQFLVALRELFRKYGLTPPRADYHLGEPLLQRVDGRLTHLYRLSWCKKSDGSDNFPYPKDRSTLFNHAEDAAILAAIPPHTWREQAVCWRDKRPNWKGEWVERGGLVVPSLAPDWAGFLQQRRQPVVRILGRYPVTWRSQFADLTFWRQPLVDATRLKRFKLLKDIQRKDFPNIVSSRVRSKVEEIAASVGVGEKGTLAEAMARQLAGEGAKRAAVEQELPRAAQELEQRFPGLRRVQVYSQKGGSVAVIDPGDGPLRKVQIKPASEGVVIWQQLEGKKTKKLKTHISVLRPRPLQRFGMPRVDPPIPPGATTLGQLHRHQIIWLEAQPDRPAGYYRVTKCQEVGVTLVPEEAVPAEIQRRLQIQGAAKSGGEATDQEGDGLTKVTLGRQRLADYFLKRRSNASRT
jgi:hypothetical protein